MAWAVGSCEVTAQCFLIFLVSLMVLCVCPSCVIDHTLVCQPDASCLSEVTSFLCSELALSALVPWRCCCALGLPEGRMNTYRHTGPTGPASCSHHPEIGCNSVGWHLLKGTDRGGCTASVSCSGSCEVSVHCSLLKVECVTPFAATRPNSLRTASPRFSSCRFLDSNLFHACILFHN